MHTFIPEDDRQRILNSLSAANAAHAKKYPGDSPERQPLHTVYGGAHLFKATSACRIGELALSGFYEVAPDFEIMRSGLGLNNLNKDTAKIIYERVIDKLKKEALEDFRIDFEDGFGHRPNQEEDQTAISAAQEVADGMAAGTLPPFIGIRIKTLSEEHKERSLRTLDLFLHKLIEK